MEELSLFTLFVLIGFGFLAAFVDSVVGGGGLISIPALLFLGLPPQTALATNKLAGSCSSLTSTITFIRSGKVDFKVVFKQVPLVFIGALGGAYVVHGVSPDILKPLVLVMLIVVTIYTLLKRDWGATSSYKKLPKKKAALFTLLMCALGFYDGFFGPGTGSFMIFAFLMIGFDFLQAAGNAKVLNFASNMGALIMFLFLGAVNFAYGIPMACAMIVGAYVGSKFALKQGVKYVRVLFIVMTVFLILKNTVDYVQQLLNS